MRNPLHENHPCDHGDADLLAERRGDGEDEGGEEEGDVRRRGAIPRPCPRRVRLQVAQERQEIAETAEDVRATDHARDRVHVDRVDGEEQAERLQGEGEVGRKPTRKPRMKRT